MVISSVADMLLLTLILSLLSLNCFASEGSVNVIEFETYGLSNYYHDHDNVHGYFGLGRTKEVTLCFKFVTRFFRSHRLFRSSQWSLWLENDNEFTLYFGFQQENVSLADGFSRFSG